MKRFFAFLLVMVCMLCGCLSDGSKTIKPSSGNEPALVFSGFNEGEPHISTMEYRLYFGTYTSTAGSCTLNIQSEIYNADVGRSLWEKVAEDLQAVSLVCPKELSEQSIFVVDRTLAGCVQVIDNKVYCTPEDITSGIYREALVRLAMGFSEPWKGVGLAGYIFGETSNEALLLAYYNEAEDMDILSLFAAYFINAFANEEELNIAGQTAVSLTNYIIKNYGIEQFFADNGQSHKQDWLIALGVEREYSDPYAGCFDGYRYSVTNEYPLIVTTKRNDVFYISPITHDTGSYDGYQSGFYSGSDFDTPQYVMSFFYKAEADLQAIFDGIAKEAPDYLQTVMDNYKEPISFYCGMIQSLAWTNMRKIETADSDTFVHEITHLLFPYQAGSYYSAVWKYETIPLYLELLFTDFNRWNEDKEEFYKLLTEENWVETYYGGNPEVNDYLEELTEYYGLVKEIYLAYAGMPETPANVNLIAFYRSNGDAERYLSSQDGGFTFMGSSIAELYPYALNSGNGNELTEAELHSFREYLVEKYSFSNYIGFCLDALTFEEAFGMEYNQAKEEWIEYIFALVSTVKEKGNPKP